MGILKHLKSGRPTKQPISRVEKLKFMQGEIMKKYVNGNYIELTPEEIAELERSQEEMPEPEPTPEERLESLETRTDSLETTTDDMILLMAELIGGE